MIKGQQVVEPSLELGDLFMFKCVFKSLARR